MIIAGLDLETTGFNVDKGDRIIEVCFGLYQYEGGELTHLKTINQRINPQRTIPVEAQKVHGISYEDVKEMPVWKDFAPTVAKILSKVDKLVIHNAGFDSPFLEGEMRNAGLPIEHRVPTFCTMENGRKLTFDGKLPSLKELCWALGVKYDPAAAHAADYDVHKMMECYKKGIKIGLFTSP